MPDGWALRAVYPVWAIRGIKWGRFDAYWRDTARNQGLSRLAVLGDIARALFTHATTPMDYFYFGFPELSEAERASYVSSLELYRYQRAVNSREAAALVGDKVTALKTFSAYVHRDWFDLTADADSFSRWLSRRRPRKVVVKDPKGAAGVGVQVLPVKTSPTVRVNGIPLDDFVHECLRRRMTLVEEYVSQHATTARIAPDSLNTVRVITRTDGKRDLHVVACILRFGSGGPLDNFDAGGYSVLLDATTGRPSLAPVAKDPQRRNEPAGNPELTAALSTLTVPYWRELIAMVAAASRQIPGLGTAGWDVAVTEAGPELVEINHNWDKTHWQVSSGKGLRAEFRAWDAPVIRGQVTASAAQ